MPAHFAALVPPQSITRMAKAAMVPRVVPLVVNQCPIPGFSSGVRMIGALTVEGAPELGR
jgi:hypothetical protein